MPLIERSGGTISVRGFLARLSAPGKAGWRGASPGRVWAMPINRLVDHHWTIMRSAILSSAASRTFGEHSIAVRMPNKYVARSPGVDLDMILSIRSNVKSFLEGFLPFAEVVFWFVLFTMTPIFVIDFTMLVSGVGE